MKVKLLITFFSFLRLASLADGQVFQASPFMQGVFGATNSVQAQSDSGFSQFSSVVSSTVISNTPSLATGPSAMTISNKVVSIQKASYQTPYAWETNGWLFDWWKPQTAQPASGSTVTRYSGRNGNTLTGTATYDPFALHGHPGIIQPSAGNGLGNSTLLETLFENSGTFAIAFRWTKPSSLPSTGEAIASASPGGDTYYWKLTPTDPNPSGDLFLSDGGSGPGGFTGGNITLDSSPLNNVHVFLATWINGVYQDYIDGALINNVPAGAYWPTSFPWQPGFMGGFYLGNSYDYNWTFSGAEGEFLLSTNFATSQIADEIQTLFLSDNGALRKTLEIDGDSIVAGGRASLGGDLDSYIDPYFAGWQVINCGVPGATTSGILTDQLYRSHVASSASPYIQIYYSNLNNNGRGDASQAGGFLATITNNMMAWATNVTAIGHIPLLVVPPSNPYTDTNGERALFTNWATNCALNYFAPPLIRLDLAPVGTNGAWQNPVFFPGIGDPHGTNAFYASIAPYFPAAVNAALAGTNFSRIASLSNHVQPSAFRFNQNLGVWFDTQQTLTNNHGLTDGSIVGIANLAGPYPIINNANSSGPVEFSSTGANGKSGFLFPQSGNAELEISNCFSGVTSFTIAIVFRDFNGTNNEVNYLLQAGGWAQNYPYSFRISPWIDAPIGNDGTGGSIGYFGFIGNGLVPSIGVIPALNRLHVYIFNFDGTNEWGFMDGQLAFDTRLQPSTSSAGLLNNATNLYIGGQVTGGASFNGIIQDFRYYTNVLSAADCAGLQAALLSMARLPQNTIGVGGDSIAVGLHTTAVMASWPQFLGAAFPNHEINVTGYSGRTLEQEYTNLETWLATKPAGKRIYFANAGVNDFDGLAGPAQVSEVTNALSWVTNIISLAVSNGVNIIWPTLMSCQAETNSIVTSNYDWRSNYNAVVRLAVPALGGILCDFASIPSVGTNGAYADSCFVDGLHPSALGYTNTWPLLYNLVYQRVYGSPHIYTNGSSISLRPSVAIYH